jgi:hypothetical protein
MYLIYRVRRAGATAPNVVAIHRHYDAKYSRSLKADLADECGGNLKVAVLKWLAAAAEAPAEASDFEPAPMPAPVPAPQPAPMGGGFGGGGGGGGGGAAVVMAVVPSGSLGLPPAGLAPMMGAPVMQVR